MYVVREDLGDIPIVDGKLPTVPVGFGTCVIAHTWSNGETTIAVGPRNADDYVMVQDPGDIPLSDEGITGTLKELTSNPAASPGRWGISAFDYDFEYRVRTPKGSGPGSYGGTP